jgi:hypothetical protein
VARLSCETCQQFQTRKDWSVMVKHGRPVPRRPRGRLPCGSCPKVPKGMPPRPSSAVEWQARHWLAYRFYRECLTVGRWPDDPLVRWYAALFRDAEEECERVLADRRHGELIALLQIRTRG